MFFAIATSQTEIVGRAQLRYDRSLRDQPFVWNHAPSGWQRRLVVGGEKTAVAHGPHPERRTALQQKIRRSVAIVVARANHAPTGRKRSKEAPCIARKHP